MSAVARAQTASKETRSGLSSATCVATVTSAKEVQIYWDVCSRSWSYGAWTPEALGARYLGAFDQEELVY